MADLLALSARFIDEGVYEGPRSINRVTLELSEVADDVAVVEAFSHVVAFRTGAGLVLFDTSAAVFGDGVLGSLRSWSDDLVHTIVYTHGHVDHVGGAGAIVEEADTTGRARPHVVAHEAVRARFARYDLTNGWNAIINHRQFGRGRLLGPEGDEPRWPRDWVQPDTTFSDRLTLTVGDLVAELRHGKGETDDHAWAWLPGLRAICSGDFFTWVFPNAGNPQKVQRYPREWSHALREMAAMGAELLLPAHGLPVAGEERIRTVLLDVAAGLDAIVEQTLALMNEGARLDQLVAKVRVPAELLEKPYLRPTYDEPEFVVRNVWRMYGGWYDGNPAHLKPASDTAVAIELAALAGGTHRLVERALELADRGDVRLACHLAELATLAEPESRDAHRARAAVYRQRRDTELSLMARGIYGAAAAESEAVAGGTDG